MNTATKVGEIFTKTQTGDTYNKIGDMIIMLAPQAHELIAIDEKNAIYYDVRKKISFMYSSFFSLFPKDEFYHNFILNLCLISATTATNSSTSQWKCCFSPTTIRQRRTNTTSYNINTGTVCPARPTTAGRSKRFGLYNYFDNLRCS